MVEPNHELTDSEAQAFQPEPHLQHLFKRSKPVQGAAPAPSRVPADRPDAPGEPLEDEDRRAARSSRRDFQ